MDQTILCPGCEAQLALPTVPSGQSVQCPRCQRVFEPARAGAPRAAAMPMRPIRPDDDEPDDRDDDFDFRHRLHRHGSFQGQGKATLAMVIIALGVLSCALQVYIQFEFIQAFQLQDELDRAPFLNDLDKFDELDRRFERAEFLSELSQPIHPLIFWAVMIAFLIWQYQASHNLRLLFVNGHSYSPGWGIVAWFLPIVNLYCPYALVQELWRTSDPQTTKTPNGWQRTPPALLVRAWWLLCLASIGLAYLGTVFDPKLGGGGDGLMGLQAIVGPDDLWNGAVSWGLAHLGFVIAGVLLIFLVKEITRRQHERYIRLYEDPV